MDSQKQQVARMVRAVLLASTTFSFAAVAHAWGGGHLPSGLGLLVLGALTAAACSAAARFRARAWWLVAFLGLLQLVLHHGFMIFTPATAHGLAATDAGIGIHHGAVDPGLVAGAADVAHAGHAMGPGMLAAHAGAVVVTALVMGAAERAAGLAWSVWTFLLPVLLGLFRPLSLPRPRSSWAPAPEPAALSRLVGSVAPRRGPPVSSLTFA